MSHFSKYIAKGKLSRSEVRKLLKDANIYKEDRFDAAVTGNSGSAGGVNLSVRNSKIFFPKADRYPNTFSILQSAIISEYSLICSYIDLTNIAEIQYARYETGNFFKKHRDTIYDNRETKRILTCSINLSEETDYEGGELVVYDNSDNEIAKLSKEIGSFIIFPATFYHEAKMVESGTRDAIVTWIHENVDNSNRFTNDINLGKNNEL
jgi:Rps23 Pro-64 3,4-dihydroxylase Tpa1-like proline 4-hydroxylase